MPSDWSSRVRLAVALALVASPFWLLPDAGATTYEYGAERIEYTAGTTGYIRADGPIDGLACYDYDDRGGTCLFAAHVAQNGPVTVNQTAALAHEYRIRTEYVVVEDSGNGEPFYRWRIERTDVADGRDRVTYALAAVGPEAVLRNVSVPVRELPAEVRPVVDGETVRTRGEPLPTAGTVVRANDAYYRITETVAPDAGPSSSEVTAARGLAVLAGLGLLRGRWRRAG